MSDIRCPICGTSNSSDLEFCQNCQARLKLVVDPFSKEDENAGKPDPLSRSERTKPEKTSELQPLEPDRWQPVPQDSEETSDQISSDESFPDEESDVKADISPKEGEETASWLSELRQSGGVDDQPSTEDEKINDDWLLEGELEDEEVPEWLSSLGSEVTITAESIADDEESVDPLEDDETPEWLRRVRALKYEEDSEERLQELVVERPELVDDEDHVPGEDDTVSPEESVELKPIEDSEEELPGLVTGLGGVPIESEVEDQQIIGEDEGETPLGDTPISDAEIPAWESGSGDAEVRSVTSFPEDQDELDHPEWSADEEKSDEAPPSKDAQEEFPEWLAGLAGAELIEKEALDSKPGAEPTDDDLSEWQAVLNEASALDEEGIPLEAGEALEADIARSEELGTFLTTVDQEDAILDEDAEVGVPFTWEEGDEDLFDDEVAEWLSEIPSQELLEEESALEPEEVIEPAELPSWLAAMRPVEAVAPGTPIPEEKVQQVERSGPLAGLSGILPAEPDIARVKKTSDYAIRLEVSDNQQAHIGMLEELIKIEGALKKVPKQAGISSQQIVRWAIFLLLLLVVLLPLLVGSQSVSIPALTAMALDTRKAIDALPDGVPVLLAVEYEPGLAGEMDAASASVVDHLMSKGAFLTMVSTSTMGPAQSERLISVVNDHGGHDYQASGQYVNLGYIPGGPTGLYVFARSLRQVMPFAFDDTPVWESGPLVNVENVSDFALVLVITENADTARAWIEQVQPTLGSTPLIMVLSAQAEPLVRPYYEGNPQQISGMVTGLVGGASYESSMDNTNLAREYWDAYGKGVLVVVVLIVLGGLVNIPNSFLTRRNQSGGGSKP